MPALHKTSNFAKDKNNRDFQWQRESYPSSSCLDTDKQLLRATFLQHRKMHKHEHDDITPAQQLPPNFMEEKLLF